MKTARFYHPAVRLLDGKVLVAGGGNNEVGSLPTAEIYKPDTGVWFKAGHNGDTAALEHCHPAPRRPGLGGGRVQ